MLLVGAHVCSRFTDEIFSGLISLIFTISAILDLYQIHVDGKPELCSEDNHNASAFDELTRNNLLDIVNDEADLVAKAAGAVKEWQSAPRAPKAWLPEAFRFAAFMLQLRAVLASNFEEHCTARCSGFIKPKGTTTCPPPGGGGD